MAWTAPRTWVTGEIVTAALMNTHVRDDLRYLKGQDGTVQIQDGLDLIGTGTLSRFRPPLLTQAQKDALSGAAQGWVIYNSGKDTPEWYGTAWEETPTVPGTSVQGDIIYKSGSAWERLAAGGSGQFLQTQGSAANPQWAAPAAAKRSLWIQPGYNNNAPAYQLENYAVWVFGGTATDEVNLSFAIPTDYSTLTKAVAVYYAGTSGTMNALYKINYAANGELYNTHTGTVIGTLHPNMVVNQLYEKDISGGFGSLAGGDYVGILVNREGGPTPGTFYFMGLLLEYQV